MIVKMRACLLILFCAWACTEAARFGHSGSSESKESVPFSSASAEDDDIRFGHRGHDQWKHSFRDDDDEESSASDRKVTVQSISATSTTQAAESNEEPPRSVKEDDKQIIFSKEIEDSTSFSREEAEKKLVDMLANHLRANSQFLKNSDDDPDKRHHIFNEKSFDYDGRQFHFNATGADQKAGKCVHEFPTFDKEPIYIYSRDLTEEERHAARLHGGHVAVSRGLIKGAKHGDLLIQMNAGMQHSHESFVTQRVRKWKLFSRINVIAFSCQESGTMCCGIFCCSEDTNTKSLKESKPKSDEKVFTDAVGSETKYIVVSYPAVAIIFQAVAVSLILSIACFAFYICCYVRRTRQNKIDYAKVPTIPVAANL